MASLNYHDFVDTYSGLATYRDCPPSAASGGTLWSCAPPPPRTRCSAAPRSPAGTRTRVSASHSHTTQLTTHTIQLTLHISHYISHTTHLTLHSSQLTLHKSQLHTLLVTATSTRVSTECDPGPEEELSMPQGTIWSCQNYHNIRRRFL